VTTTAQYFDKRSGEWEELYRHDPRFARRFELLTKFIAPVVKKHEVRRALDYGCGTGLYSRWLASQGIDVTGLDISPQMLEQARQLSRDLEITFTSDLSQIMLTKFDAIFALSVLEYVDNVEQLLQAFASATNKGGLLIASIPNPGGAVRRMEALIFGLRRLTKGRLFGNQGDYLAHQRWSIRPTQFDALMAKLGYEKVDQIYYNAAFALPPNMLPLFEKRWWAALYAGAYVKV
jgi:2-polyprenyl-3-methyl-5-hydroxy-6-metoxy-1,4-benzoquinol methylase